MTKTADRVLLSEVEFKKVQIALVKSGQFFIAGTCTLSVPAIKTKYLIEKACKIWPTIDGDEIHMPPGEAARTELKRAFPDIKRIGWAKGHVVLFDKRPPLMYSGHKRGEMTYVDLKGAYHQLYRRLWLDAPYPRATGGRYHLRPVADRLEKWKAARNSVVGISRNRHIVAIKEQKRLQLSAQNPYLSPFLWATIQDLLQWIAVEAVAFGAIYINTDGYVFEGTDSSDRFIEHLFDRGLVATVRASGEGHIRGWSNYRIGETSTAAYENSRLSGSIKEFSNVKASNKWADYWSKVSRNGPN